MREDNKKKKWIKPRHKVVRNIAAMPLGLYSRWKYGITIEPCRALENRQCIILLNHQTAFDQFFVGLAFKQPIYYLASEDLFSNGWVSSLIRYLVEPIPIKKQTTDIQAVKNCIRVVKEGGSIAIAPEGNRTFSGETEYMNPAIGGLVKKLGLPIALLKLEGGYGVQPRWSDVVRKGKMKAYVTRVIEPEEYKELSADELFTIVEKELYVNEASVSGMFKHKKSAEYLERAMYVCPYCGLSVFESHDDIIECKKCNRKVQYLPTKQLKGVGFDFPYEFVLGWYDYQCDFINSLDVREYIDTSMYQDSAKLSEVILNKRKEVLCEEAKITLYGNRIVIEGTEEKEYFFDELSAVTILGRNKLNIYHEGRVYQLKGDKRFNALKYVNIYHRYKNITKENRDVKFLGL